MAGWVAVAGQRINIIPGCLSKFVNFMNECEDEDSHSKFAEFEDLGEFDLFASKEPCSIRVRGLQVSAVGLFHLSLFSTYKGRTQEI